MSLYTSKIYFDDLTEAIEMTVQMERLKRARILVTGATGTVGSFLVDMFLHYNQTNNADITVYAAGRSKERLARRFDEIKTDRLIYVEYDITGPITFDFQVDYILHAAGNAYPAAFNRDPVGTIAGNILGTKALLDYGWNHGIKRLLYVSSGEVYGQGDLTQEAFEETYSGYLDFTNPRSCYPESKRLAETLCISYTKQFGLETVIVRLCHTYGPGIMENDNRANVQFVRNILNGEDIVMKSAGDQMRSYCYIADCASVILTVLLNGTSGEAYNSANSASRVTIVGLAETMANAAGCKVVFTEPTAIELADRTPIAWQVLSSKKVEKLGWKGRYNLERGVAHLLAIMQE